MGTKKEKRTVMCVCENPDCGKVFTFELFGGPLKKYCSERCRRHTKSLAKKHGSGLKKDETDARKSHVNHRELTAMVRRRRARERASIERIRQVEVAKRIGLKTAFGICRDCGERFEYVAETVIGYRISEDLDLSSVRRQPKTLEFCTKSCKNHYNWIHRGKIDYERKKADDSKRATLIITRRRGSGGFYGDGASVRIMKSGEQNSASGTFDDSTNEPVDLSGTLGDGYT